MQARGWEEAAVLSEQQQKALDLLSAACAQRPLPDNVRVSDRMPSQAQRMSPSGWKAWKPPLRTSLAAALVSAAARRCMRLQAGNRFRNTGRQAQLSK